MLSNRPTALIREALVLSYIQKWLDDEMKYLETVELGRAIMPFVDHLHKLCLFQIVKVKTKLRKIGVKVVDQKVYEKDIWVEYLDSTNRLHQAVYPVITLKAEAQSQLSVTINKKAQPIIERGIFQSSFIN